MQFYLKYVPQVCLKIEIRIVRQIKIVQVTRDNFIIFSVFSFQNSYSIKLKLYEVRLTIFFFLLSISINIFVFLP